MDEQNFDLGSVPETAEQANQLVEAIEASSQEAPAQSQENQVAQEPVQPVGEPQYPIKWRGEERVLPLSKILSYAQQAHDYNEKMREFNLQRSLFEKDRGTVESRAKELSEKLARYEQIDSYIKSNPSWWEHVNGEYQKVYGQPDQGHSASPLNPVVDELKRELTELKTQFSHLSEKEKIEQQVKQDSELDQSISSYKEKYSDFDWNSKDENGWDLERRIIDHAIALGTQNFEAAANSYLFDEFMKRAEMRGKEQVGKNLKEASKLGLGPVTDKPTAQIKKAKGLGSKSYDDLLSESLQELGLG